jgi:hypothetical protein
MARPTNAQLAADNAVLRRRITVALELHQPVPDLTRYRVAGFQTGRAVSAGPPVWDLLMCRICRDPYPCDTAVALGDRP